MMDDSDQHEAMSNTLETSESDWEIVNNESVRDDQSAIPVSRESRDADMRKDESVIQPASQVDEIKDGSVRDDTGVSVNPSAEVSHIKWSGKASNLDGFMNQSRVATNVRSNLFGGQAVMHEAAPADRRVYQERCDLQSEHPLLTAIDSGRDLLARTMVESGADVNATDSQGRHPLVAAIESNKDFDLLARMMVEKGANLAAADRQGRPVLLMAIDSGRDLLARMVESANLETLGRSASGRSSAKSPLETETSPVARAPSSFRQISFNGVLPSHTYMSIVGPDGNIQVNTGSHPATVRNVSVSHGSCIFIGNPEEL